MHQSPTPEQLLAAVSHWLRAELLPLLSGQGEAAQAYQTRVAANMLDTVGRQLQQSPAADRAERQRLQALLGEAADHDDLAALNQALARALADGRLDARTPGLADHLWATTQATLAVDQPGYDRPPLER